MMIRTDYGFIAKANDMDIKLVKDSNESGNDRDWYDVYVDGEVTAYFICDSGYDVSGDDISDLTLHDFDGEERSIEDFIPSKIVQVEHGADYEIYAREGYSLGGPAVKVIWGFGGGTENELGTFAIAYLGSLDEDGDFDICEGDIQGYDYDGWDPSSEDVDWDEYGKWISEFCQKALSPKGISLNNGHSYVTPAEAIKDEDWDVIAHYMDDEIRNRVHNEFAPCSKYRFLTRYLELASEDLIIG